MRSGDDADADRKPASGIEAPGDGVCLVLATRMRAIRDKVDAIMDIDKRDIEDIPGLVELWDELAGLVNELCATPAHGLVDIVAKAELAIFFAGREGDQGARIALSLAGDIASSRNAIR